MTWILQMTLLCWSLLYPQAQLTYTTEAAKNLDLIISIPKTEYITANCHLQPSLQVYGVSINHVADFKYLGSKMASAASDFKRCKALVWSAFWKLLEKPQLTISAKSTYSTPPV